MLKCFSVSNLKKKKIFNSSLLFGKEKKREQINGIEKKRE